MKKHSLLILSFLFCTSLAESNIDKYPEYFLGKNGWVVSKLDYTDIVKLRDVKSGWPQTHFDLAAKVVKSLESKGIKVIMAIVPQRLNVYPQILPDDLFTDFTATTDSYSNLMPEILRRDIKTVDLLKVIKSSNAYNSKLGTYYRLEPHWSFNGASVAAKAIADLTKSSFPDLKLPIKKYVLKISPTIPRKDIFWLKNFPKNIQATVPMDLEIPYTVTAPVDSSSALLEESAPAVTIVGTSFTGYGFKQALLVDLSTDILDVSLPGKGMWTPMTQYIDSPAFLKNKPKLIIWEMPEYILSNYPLPTESEYKVLKVVLGVEK